MKAVQVLSLIVHNALISACSVAISVQFLWFCRNENRLKPMITC